MALLTVKTKHGYVEGLPAGNQSISLFKGVPFAKPPVGELRWRAPQEMDDWEGVLPCYKFGKIPMQERFSSEGGGNTLAAQEFYVIDHPMSEDCLYLNIWTPAKRADEKLPVAVYIHGGGMETGYSYLNAYDGEGFAKRGVIMVTIAYRLGIFGFMAHEDLAAEEEGHTTGNYGIMDQIAALKWVNENIEAFGGDADNITIFGQSAGGVSVMSILASPLADGLYQRAIMQSCGGLTRSAFLEELPYEKAAGYTKEFLSYLGASSPKELRERSAEELLNAFIDWKGGPGSGYSQKFQPCVDGYVHPMPSDQYFREGRMPADLDVMVGCTRDEMRRAGAPAPAYEVIEAGAKAQYGDLADAYLAAIEAKNPEVCAGYLENPMGSAMLAADLAWCENALRLNRKPAYAYYFTYVPPGAENAHHSVEHHYVFQTLVRSKRPYTGKDFDLSNLLCDAWTNFIRCGNPNGEDADDVYWKPYTDEKREALIIDGEGRGVHMGEIELEPQVSFLMKYSLGDMD